MIKFLKKNRIIEDESQIALLLHSVKQDHSIHYLEELKEQGIKTFCPRARAYFENYEIQYMIACFALLLGYYGDGRGQIKGYSLKELAAYVDEGITELGRRFPDPHPLAKCLQRFSDALMSFPYRSEREDEAGTHFDKVVESILNKDFAVKKSPEQKVCKECDLRRLCKNDKVIIL